MRLIGNVEKDAQVRAVASGALPSGDAVVVNADGTVSVVAPTTEAIGSPVVYSTGRETYTAAAYDSNAQKVVIVFSDQADSFYGKAVVGTVSGTSISFGTTVVFNSGTTTDKAICFDSDNNKVVIAYDDAGNSAAGTAIVGTVSGTSISFGTEAVFDSGGNGIVLRNFPIAYDANSQKVVISYYISVTGGQDGKAVVGTVSGTSISFGTPVIYNSGPTWSSEPVYDTNAQKVVICYRDNDSGNQGTAKVGTISGTSISFGSASVFDSGGITSVSTAYDINAQKIVIGYTQDNTNRHSAAVVGTVSGTSISFGTPVNVHTSYNDHVNLAYDSDAQKIAFVYPDGDNSDYGTLKFGTVSGTSISIGSAIVFAQTTVSFDAVVYDSGTKRLVMAYEDVGNSEDGTAVVYRAAVATNLTSENFLGFAAHTYADTQSALVNSTCTVDRNQSGLTAGQTYYVQTDGSLGTTAADPSVEAGTAISSTEIIVKG